MKLKRSFFKMNFRNKLKIVTHNGAFHADDIFAVAVLNLVYEGQIKIIRSRDLKKIEEADIVLDVSGKYNPEKKQFDHHQENGAGERENGIPYASFGLIWKSFGQELVNSETVHKIIDEELVQQIDAEDTGYCDFYSEKLKAPTWTFDNIFRTFYPSFSEIDKSKLEEEFYKNFLYLVDFASEFLQKIIKKTTKKVSDWQKVEDIYEKSKDKRIIILDEGLSWSKPITSKKDPLYVIFPNNFGSDYLIRAVPVKEGTYELRKPFPVEWRGKEESDLQRISGNSGARFCHNTGFLMRADSLEDAIFLAKKAVDD